MGEHYTGDRFNEMMDHWSGLVARKRFNSAPAWVAPSVRATGGVLVDGATEQAIRDAEARLGTALPPSYRRFLTRSNGAYGGHLGLQVDPPRRGRGEGELVSPRSLLPVEAIGFVAEDDPLLVDGAALYQAPAQHGQSTLHQPRRGDEVAYLAAPWSGANIFSKRGHAHWSVRIGWDDDPAAVMLLNPLVQDGAGEWELVVIQDEEDFRYASFEAWLDHVLERERSTQPAPGRARSRLEAVTATNPAGVGAAEALVDLEDDPTWMVDRLETALAPGVSATHQRRALHLLEWTDLEHGTASYAEWVGRMFDDRLYDHLALVGRVADSRLPGLPAVAELVARNRSGDIADLSTLPTADLVAAYEAAPDPMLAEFLEQRGHPLVVDGRRAALDVLVPDDRRYFRPATRGEVDAPPHPDHLTSWEIIETGARYELRRMEISRALVRAGHADDAVDYLEASLDDSGDVDLLYTLAEIDTGRAWAVLDHVAATAASPLALVALEAAARTRSPLLADRAGPMLDGTEVENLTAQLALEIQPTEEAAAALLDAWRHRNNLGALRALARRQDERILDDCLLLLADDDDAIARVGAETLRDLRHESSRASLLIAIELAGPDDIVVILAHTLAMLGAIEAAPAMRARAELSDNDELAGLLRRWADQLLARAAGN